MAAARVQAVGAGGNALSTSTVLSVSKVVTSGNTIIVGTAYYAAAGTESVTDNLGNTYTRVERVDYVAMTASLWYAPVTLAGTLTTLTFNHPSSSYNTVIADEFSGVGTPTAAGASGATSTSVTWASNKTISANGLAIGMASSAGAVAPSAGAASGSPSTAISTGGTWDVGSNLPSKLLYSIAGASDVTAFTGTGTVAASAQLSSAGATFPVSSGTTVNAAIDAGIGAETQTIMVTPDETGTGTETATPLADPITAKTATDTGAGLEGPPIATVPITPTVTPTMTVRIDWNNDGDFLDANENVSARVLGLSWTRGRSADFSAEATGSATITLRNDDALYDPDGATGPTADQLVPGRPVHISATYLGVDYPEFFGYIERLAYDPRERTVTITAYDPLRRLGETDIVVPASSYVQRSAHDFRVAVLEDAERGVRNLLPNGSFEVNTTGWTEDDGDGAQGAMTRITTDAATGAGAACAEVVATGINYVVSARTRMAPVYFAGQIYRFSVYLRCPSGSANVYLGLLTNRTGMPTAPAVAPKAVTIDTTWRRYTVTFTIGETYSASSAAGLSPVPLTAYVGTTGAMTIRMDGAVVTRGQALYPYAETDSGRWPNWVGNGSFDGGALNGWYDGWTNLVTNPSFEVDAIGWTNLTRVVSAPLFGAAHAQMTTSASVYACTGLTFQAGATYDVRLWIRASGGSVATGVLRIESTGTPTDGAQLISSAVGETWTEKTWTWTPSVDRTDVRLVLGPSGTNIWMDGVAVTRRDLAASSGPSYSNTGPGAGGSFVTTRALSTTVKYGSQSQQVTTPATATAGRVYDFGHLGPYFVSGRPYTASVWLRPTSNMPYKLGFAANKGDGTWDEASTTGTATANAWTQITVTWTPSADRSSASSMNVVLFVYQTDATARTVLVDGVRVIPGSVADDFEMSQWSFAPEPDTYLPTAGLSGSALSALSTINGLTLSRHWIKPTMTSPWYQYVTRSRSQLLTKVSAETYNDDLNDMTNEDVDRAGIVNIVPVAYAGGTEYYSDSASVTAYGSRPTGAIGSASFLADLTVPDAIGAALLAQYKDPRARPEITVENRWPSQLQRELDDMVTVTFNRLSISAKRYLIARLTTTVSDSGNRWRTVLALEESAY